jgi:hypothetical protein
MRVHLTDIVVQRLQNPGTYFDELTPGLSVRVRTTIAFPVVASQPAPLFIHRPNMRKVVARWARLARRRAAI